MIRITKVEPTHRAASRAVLPGMLDALLVEDPFAETLAPPELPRSASTEADMFLTNRAVHATSSMAAGGAAFWSMPQAL